MVAAAHSTCRATPRRKPARPVPPTRWLLLGAGALIIGIFGAVGRC